MLAGILFDSSNSTLHFRTPAMTPNVLSLAFFFFANFRTVTYFDLADLKSGDINEKVNYTLLNNLSPLLVNQVKKITPEAYKERGHLKKQCIVGYETERRVGRAAGQRE